jgi:hypothetical protein
MRSYKNLTSKANDLSPNIHKKDNLLWIVLVLMGYRFYLIFLKRSRIELPMTIKSEKAMLKAASIGLRKPTAASGMATIL